MGYIVNFEPVGRRVEAADQETLLEAAQQAGVDILAVCGGIGICGTCRARVMSGMVSPANHEEQSILTQAELNTGMRLACQCQIHGDVRVDIPPESLPVSQKLQVEGKENVIALAPAVQAQELVLKPPAGDDLRSDFSRLVDALPGNQPIRATPIVIGEALQKLRNHKWQGRAVINRRSQAEANLVTILQTGEKTVGLAVDIGSTKIAVYLIDLASGVTVGSKGLMNPQIAYGEDVISRIAYANKGGRQVRQLQQRLVEAINAAAAELCNAYNIDTSWICDVVIVGNTAMHHFLAGFPVEQLGAAPYVAAVSDPLDFLADEIGLMTAKGAWVHFPANIAGHVGADHTSALLSTRVCSDHMTKMLVDIGTNTEISLVAGGKIYTCSTASGPAFEGAHIHDGMRAAPGAIDRVKLTDGQVRVDTIASISPIGICGTGILSAVAELLNAGVLDQRGSFTKEAHPYTDRVRRGGGKTEFILVEPDLAGNRREVIVSRNDIHEIQLAKGAIRTGIDVLLREAGIAAGQVDQWIIAGAFGTYLDLTSAIRIGMFPPEPVAHFVQVGNAAGMGAKQMLISAPSREEATRLARGTKYIELTTYPDFTDRFVANMYFQK